MSAELKRRLRAHYEACAAIMEAWRERDYSYPPPARPEFPKECRGLTCGAKTRKGIPCRQKDIYLNGRCRLHGGLSTGPKTAAGKQRSAANLPKPHEKPTKLDFLGVNASGADSLLLRRPSSGNCAPP